MRKMKDSGLDIVGQMPTEWDFIRLRYLCDITTGDSDTQDADPDGEYPFYVRSPIVERSTKFTFNGEGILMAGDGAGAGRVFHHALGKYAVHQRVYRLYNFKVNSNFLFYYISNLFPSVMDKGSAQSTVPSVRLPMLLNFEVCFPPLAEQQRIADFLDEKCGEIDSICSDIQKQIDILNDYKKSVITEAVTKGLNPKAKLKDSGIEWIGKIPEGWVTRRLKELGKVRNGLTYSPTDICDSDEGYLVLRSSNIKDGKLSFEDNVFVSCRIPHELIVQKGDILICSRNGSRKLIGKNAIIEDIGNGRITYGAFMMIFRTKYPKYIYYILNSGIFSYYLGSFFTSTINQLTGFDFGNMAVPFCTDDEEQKAIADYLDEKCSEIDATIADKQRQLETLDEYKKSLIFEYVTGKKEVS
ncbi:MULTISPECIES: restriction endonuclease subunit S [unclassified Fibrobacter]|uniref:restriction endonuclease subunit S n=1 Tax=unclassified Fibrobacter TaxID=2634177 RepID=UPI0025C4C10E|nr:MULTISPECIES: restriction endonuclease subunit S [unclassified Fibrobacter]